MSCDQPNIGDRGKGIPRTDERKGISGSRTQRWRSHILTCGSSLRSCLKSTTWAHTEPRTLSLLASKDDQILPYLSEPDSPPNVSIVGSAFGSNLLSEEADRDRISRLVECLLQKSMPCCKLKRDGTLCWPHPYRAPHVAMNFGTLTRSGFPRG